MLPLLTAGETNQGVAEFIGNDWIAYRDCISVDMFGNTFYHNYKSAGDDNIYFFENNSLSHTIKLFITASIQKSVLRKYSYGYQFRQSDADNLAATFPANDQGEPDFEYMEQYIKNYLIKQYNQYLNYLNIK